jgi:vacuolar-type H+-ATPase subunit H
VGNDLKELLKTLEDFEREADALLKAAEDEKKTLNALLERRLNELRAHEEELIQKIRERILAAAKEEIEASRLERLKRFEKDISTLESKLKTHKEDLIKAIQDLVIPKT